MLPRPPGLGALGAPHDRCRLLRLPRDALGAAAAACWDLQLHRTLGNGGTSVSPWCTACSQGLGHCSGEGLRASGGA